MKLREALKPYSYMTVEYRKKRGDLLLGGGSYRNGILKSMGIPQVVSLDEELWEYKINKERRVLTLWR